MSEDHGPPVELQSMLDRGLSRNQTRTFLHLDVLHLNFSIKDKVKTAQLITCLFFKFNHNRDFGTDWLYKCFFPQEDSQKLMMYRSQLSPFLKMIMIALSVELGNLVITSEEFESICDEIIRQARSLSTISTPNSPQTSSNQNTLQMEHNHLKLNMK